MMLPALSKPCSLNVASFRLTYDRSINYGFQQNAIPVIKELVFKNDANPRKVVIARVTSEPAFALSAEIRLAAVAAEREPRSPPLDLRLSHDFLAGLDERVAGWMRVEVVDGDEVRCSITESMSLLARNEWCGFGSLPETLAAFVLPNAPAVMASLSRAAEFLREHVGRSGFNGYQDKNRARSWDHVNAIYRAVGELGIRSVLERQIPARLFRRSAAVVARPRVDHHIGAP